MKKLIIYSGRFQPFGKHHYQSYLHLCEKFGSDNVYICTSNKTDENSPLTFDEKLKITKNAQSLSSQVSGRILEYVWNILYL